jgi:hypothetical protein
VNAFLKLTCELDRCEEDLRVCKNCVISMLYFVEVGIETGTQKNMLVSQLVRFCAHYGTRMSIAVFTESR